MKLKSFDSTTKKSNASILLALVVLMTSPSLFAAPVKSGKAKTVAASKASTKKPTLIASASPTASDSSINSASAASTSATKLMKDAKAETPKAFAMTLGLEHSSNMYEKGDVGQQASTSLTIAPALKLSTDFTLAGELIVEKLSTGTGDTSVSNTTIALAMAGATLNSKTKLSHSVSAILPTNEEVREKDRLQGAGALGTKIIFESPSLNAVGSVSLRKNVHEFEINAENAANVEYSFNQRLDLEFPLSEKFALTATGIYRSGWTYEGSQRNSFVFDAGLDFAASTALTLSVGTTNDASTLQANGRDSNIALFDENTSVVRAGMTYKF